jgi:hypothetical protein
MYYFELKEGFLKELNKRARRSCKFFDSQKYFGFSKLDKKNVQFSIQETYLGKSLFVRP